MIKINESHVYFFIFDQSCLIVLKQNKLDKYQREVLVIFAVDEESIYSVAAIL